MAKLYFGKIAKNYPRQFEENFYAAGNQRSTWYGGLSVGDYVFPIYDNSIKKLWQVEGYSSQPNFINEEGSVKFKVLNEYSNPIPISSAFLRYRYFDLDINLLNKSVKSTGNERIGFFEIACSKGCPSPERIEFKDLRSITVSLERPDTEFEYHDQDIRILIDEKKNLGIVDIQIFTESGFTRYSPLYDLYKTKNREDGFYTLRQLLDFSVKDKAGNKEKYLSAVINEIADRGLFIVTNPVALYDNVLVGRKKTQPRRPTAPDTPPEIQGDSESTLEDFGQYKEFVELLKFSPNMILYGPPGTGKTYSAERIIEAFQFDRTGKARSFNKIQNDGRATSVTFHQSFSYEEFVEGLRPVIQTDDEDANSDGSQLRYIVQPGILMKIANDAALNQISTDPALGALQKVTDSNRIWKISLGEKGVDDWLYQDCLDTNTIAIGWFDEDLSNWDYDKIYDRLVANLKPDDPKPINNATSINYFVHELQENDIVLVFASVTSIRAIGVVEGPYYWDKRLKGRYAQRRRVKWVRVFQNPVDIRRYNGSKRLSQVTLYELTNVTFLEMKNLLEVGKPATPENRSSTEPYFLIIDEINRGNISKVFGELITLIEKDKRDINRVLLPYSRKEFTLPSNLYIIGTMNTADRSIALLDIALRRRFLFKEIEPSSKVIRDVNQFIDGDLDVAALLDNLNAKIEEKLDRDHRIGHSYFLEPLRLADLRTVWYHQIIPLLMEYFYGDGKAIADIIGDLFIDRKTCNLRWIDEPDEFKKALQAIG